ncbi:hypothetical protein DSO57_1003321 [Entomophthora muscae]|uniref:Uncharacterized protein n=1 Tax=Entomophthora muscae TaxID=34485 RepID=A0ACC2T8A8_9FUNG|nr:hypothetical protein DSO57_1003321 [Entomophthora muscae]
MLAIIRRAQGISRPTKLKTRTMPRLPLGRVAYHVATKDGDTKADNLLEPYLEKIIGPNANPKGVKLNMQLFPYFNSKQMVAYCKEMGFIAKVIKERKQTFLQVQSLDGRIEEKKAAKMASYMDELMSVTVPMEVRDGLSRSLDRFDEFMDRVGNKVLEATNTAALYSERASGGVQLMRPVRKIETPPFPPQMVEARQRLPMTKLKDQVLDLIRNNQATVVSGATGSGKSTQLPQYMLDDLGPDQVSRIIVVQPRRISATSLARRVCDERGCTLGQQVGYQVRNDKKLSPATQILFVTTGILLRRFAGDPTLSGFSHVVMDEVHERSLESDFCLAILKRVMAVRKDLKLVAMSATFKSSLFTEYLTLDAARPAQSYDVPGISYPVKVIPLEEILQDAQVHLVPNDLNQPPRPNSVRSTQSAANKMLMKMSSDELDVVKQEVAQRYDSFSQNVKHSMAILHPVFSAKLSPGSRLGLAIWEVNIIIQILQRIHSAIRSNRSPKGAVLVFLPGWNDISAIKFAIDKSPVLSRYCTVLPLHSAVSPEEQRLVFEEVPENRIKVVLATNVAETGITINDAVYVIDTGKVRESDFDPDSRINSLAVKWITKANAKQRAGRAGRVSAGFCFRLYPQTFFDNMADFPIPEVQRTSLDSVILQVLHLSLSDGMSIQGFLRTFIDPPSAEQIDFSIRGLRSIGAIEEERELLTPLGRVLATLPLDPRDGKMLVYGTLFDALPSALTIAAARERDIFAIPHVNDRTQASQVQRKLSGNSNSDPIATINGFHRSNFLEGNDFQDFCQDHFISRSNIGYLLQLRRQLTASLKECGLLPFDFSRSAESFKGVNYGNNVALVRLRALLAASLYPNICKIQIPENPQKNVKLLLEAGLEGTLPLGSTVLPREASGKLAAANEWIVYSGLFVGRNLEAQNLVPSLISPTIIDSLTLLFFSGGEISISDAPGSKQRKGRPEPISNNPKKHITFKTPNQLFRFDTDSTSAQLISRVRNGMNNLLLLHLSQASSSQENVRMSTSEKAEFQIARTDLINTIFYIMSAQLQPRYITNYKLLLNNVSS